MYNCIRVFTLIGAISSIMVVDSFSVRGASTPNPCPLNFTGNIPNPADCHSFYICDTGIPGLIPCPVNLCFNQGGGDGNVGGGGCDHCELVPGCGSVTGSPTSQAPSTSTSGSSSVSQETTTSKGSEAPSTTSQSPPVSSSSPPASSSSPPASSSSPPVSSSSPPASSSSPPVSSSSPPVSSSSPPVSSSSPSTTTEAPASSSTTTLRSTTSNSGGLTCPQDKPYIYMPVPGDCNKFYYCQDGVNTGVYNCGVGLWFNFRSQVCALPWGDSCEN